MPPMLVDAGALKAMVADGQELAIVDLREELTFSQGHLLFARSVPLSRLELKFAGLVPRPGTRVVLCDDGDGLVERAAEILSCAGYSNVHALDGGVPAWAKAGFELFSGVNVPSKELVLRIRDLAPSPETMVVVNCAGRTRSIIGAQSLINAGVPNKVVALRNGTMGWSLAGFACDSGKAARAPEVSRDGLAWAKTAAERVARRFGIARIDLAT